MKVLKSLIAVFLIGIFAVSLSSCGKECDGEQPRARILNNGTVVANVQIKTSGGNTENINNIMPGTASDYRNFAPGNTVFTITVDKKDFVKEVVMTECFEYDIAIDANNNVTSTPIDRNEK